MGQGEHLGAMLPRHVISDVYISGLGHVLIAGIIALPSPAVPLSTGAMNMPVLYLPLLQQPSLHPPTSDYYPVPWSCSNVHWLLSAVPKDFSAKKPSRKYH